MALFNMYVVMRYTLFHFLLLSRQ